MEGMFFNGWFALLRTTVVGILAYAALVVLLRPTEDGNTGYMLRWRVRHTPALNGPRCQSVSGRPELLNGAAGPRRDRQRLPPYGAGGGRVPAVWRYEI